MMKKGIWIFAMVAILVGAVSLGFISQPADPISDQEEFIQMVSAGILLTDNFGIEWDINATNCSDAPGGKCIDGLRDINVEVFCGTGSGPFVVHGTVANGIFSVTSFDTPADGCITASWRGSASGGSISGTWHNEGGGTGAFTLSPAAPITNAAGDPMGP